MLARARKIAREGGWDIIDYQNRTIERHYGNGVVEFLCLCHCQLVTNCPDHAQDTRTDHEGNEEGLGSVEQEQEEEQEKEQEEEQKEEQEEQELEEEKDEEQEDVQEQVLLLHS